MLILPPGHAHDLRASRRLTSREKWILRSVGLLVAALAAAVAIAVLSGGHASGNGCIDVTVPYSIGGQEFYKCGAPARAMCAEVGAANGFTGAPGRAVAAACRKANLPVGR